MHQWKCRHPTAGVGAATVTTTVAYYVYIGQCDAGAVLAATSGFSGIVTYATVTTNYTVMIEQYRDGKGVRRLSLYEP